MKQDFSMKWKASEQVRKQRKYRANAPLHIQSKMLGSHLSKELRKKHETRAIGIRKGDEVKVLRGNFKGKTGKIGIVDIKKQRVTIDGLQNKKKDGTKINVYFNASNLMITNLNLEDKKRLKRITKPLEKVSKEKEKIKEAKK